MRCTSHVSWRRVVDRTAWRSALLVGVLLLSARAPASDEEPEPLRVVVAPASLVLERNATPVEVLITAPDGAELSQLRLFTSSGTLSAAVPVEGAAAWRAVYTPPDAFHPHVALVVALARVNHQTEVAWTALPLLGQGTMTVRASPGSAVTLDVAGRSFGPVRANAAGEARVPVEVPPGHDAAYFRGRAVPIDGVPFSRVLLVPEERRLSAGVADELRVHAFTVARTGEPLDVVDLRVEASDGTLSAPIHVGRGHAVLRYQVPPVSPREVTLSARLGDDAEPPSEARVSIVAGAPVRLELTLARARFVAGEGPVALRVRVLDDNGVPTGAASLSVEAEGARLGERTTSEAGVFEIPVRPPDTLPDERVAHLSARASVPGHTTPLLASVELPLVPAAPARIVIEPARESIVADGEGAHLLAAEVVDAFGNRVLGAPLVASAALGRARVVPSDRWPYAISYTPPAHYDDVVETIEARAGDVVGVLRPALAARPKRFFLTALLGGLTNFAGLHAPALSLDAAYRVSPETPWLRGLELTSTIAAFHRFIAGSVTSAGTIDTHLTGVPVTIGARYHVELLPTLHGYAGARAGPALFNSLLLGQGHSVERFVAAFGAAEAGLTWALGPGALVVELGAGGYLAETPATVSGFLGGLTLLGGYRVALL